AILGARIAYVGGHFEEFRSPIEWFQIWRGGISLIGGILGGVIVAAAYMRRHRLPFGAYADLGAPGLALGIALGRSGDLAIGDHLGKPTGGWWGWVYRGGELISPPPCSTPAGGPVYPTPDGCIVSGMTVHQTALYDSLWSLVVLGALVVLERKPRRPGFLFLAWVSLYALGRIVTDFLRVDKTWVFGMTGSQLTSLGALLVCLYLLARYRGAPPRRTPETAPAISESPRPADQEASE
ncbi:MAG: prolipoprotein diacylglyceryl transferase, partial [Candidatus Methylomirabilales bacterium]